MEVYGTSAETVLVLARSLRDTMGNDAPDATAIIAVLFYLRVGHWELAHLAWVGWQALQSAKTRWRTPRVYADEVVQTLRAISWPTGSSTLKAGGSRRRSATRPTTPKASCRDVVSSPTQYRAGRRI
jgi:hypothetical protein